MIRQLPFFLILLALLYGAYTDRKHRVIPNIVPGVIFLCGFFTTGHITSKAVSLLIIISSLFVAKLITHKSSGGGDIKTYCALSFALMIVPTLLILGTSLILILIQSILRKTIVKGKKFPMCCYMAASYTILYILLPLIGGNVK